MLEGLIIIPLSLSKTVQNHCQMKRQSKSHHNNTRNKLLQMNVRKIITRNTNIIDAF